MMMRNNSNKLAQHTHCNYFDAHRSVIPGSECSRCFCTGHAGWKTWGVSASVGGVWDHWRRHLFLKLAVEVLQMSCLSCGKCFGTEDLLRRTLRCSKRFVQDKQQSKKTDCRMCFYDAQGKVASNQEGKKWRNPPIVCSRPERCGSQEVIVKPSVWSSCGSRVRFFCIFHWTLFLIRKFANFNFHSFKRDMLYEARFAPWSIWPLLWLHIVFGEWGSIQDPSFEVGRSEKTCHDIWCICCYLQDDYPLIYHLDVGAMYPGCKGGSNQHALGGWNWPQ